jgi:hypothetical protein
MKKSLLAICIAASMAFSATTIADDEPKTTIEDEGKVHITWHNYDDYQDIRPATQTRGSFRRQVFKQFNKHFEKLAEALPGNHVLKLTVTDVDLAGMVFPNNGPIPIRGGFINMGQTGMDIRVMEPIHIPRMDFSFELVDENQEVLLSDNVELKDMAFFDRTTTRVRHRPFAYEKRMIEDWFEDTIESVYAENLVKK